MLQRLPTYASAIFIVPFLSILGLALFIIGILFPILTIFELTNNFITNFFRQFNPNFTFSVNLGLWTIPRILWLPTALIFGICCLLTGRFLWQTLSRFIAFIVA